MNSQNKAIGLAAIIASVTSLNVTAFELGEFGGTKVSLSGYVKAEGIYEDPKNSESSFFGRGNQTRFGIKTQTNKDGLPVLGFVEGDFYGGAYPTEGNDFRLRHAFVKVGNTTFGQTWTGQFWAVAYPDYLDFLGGPRGTLGGLNFRTSLVSYKLDGLRFTAQDPVRTGANTPDIAINYNLPLSGGSKLILTASGREVENGDFVAGAALGSKFMMGKHSVNINLHHGKGLAAFTGVGVNGSLTGEIENNEAVSQTGYNIAFRYVISPEWRTNLAYTSVEVDDQANTEYESQRVNLIHNILPELEVGIEWRKHSLSFGPLIPEGQQVEVMAKYSF